MPQTANLGIEHLQGASSQKHVTVNEAFRTLDALSQLSVIDKDRIRPPSQPNNGDIYIVANNATGLWAGQENNIAYYTDEFWYFHQPKAGWLAVINDEGSLYRYTGAAWVQIASGQPINNDALGADTSLVTVAETITITTTIPSNPITNIITTIQFPTRSIILGVSVRVTSAIEGVSAFMCGRSSGGSEFGNLLDVREGTFNRGVVGPFPIYQNESPVITAIGGHFTAGTFVVSLHYISISAPNG